MSPRPDRPTAEELSQQRLTELLVAMEGQGLTQQQVAARAGLPPQYLSDIKRGRRPMTELVARRLGEEFALNYEWLLGTSDSKGKPQLESAASGSRLALLPILFHPTAGDPRLAPHWDGSLLEIAGTAAAQMVQAEQPYILRFGRDDVQGRLRRGDLILISQSAGEHAEICVVQFRNKLWLARRHQDGWERVAREARKRQGTIMPPTCAAVGHCLGIVWAPLVAAEQ